MLFIPYSTALSFNKQPYISYIISALCLLIFYSQFNNEIKIQNALSNYCDSVQGKHSVDSELDFLVKDNQQCVAYLYLLHERSEHGGFELINKELRENSDKYYSAENIVKIDQHLQKHLTSFRQSAPQSLTGRLMHYPNEFSPVAMLTSAFAHADWGHVIFNLIFFLAFAPAIEIIISNHLKFLSIIIGISFITGIAYSLSILLSSEPPIPTLGLSGVVTGMIGLSAYLMPHAKIRVLVWFFTIIKTFHISAWVLALWYIGWDTFDILFSDDNGNVNLIAHVSGGLAGYLIAYFWLKDRRDEIREELDDEIEFIRSNRASGSFNANYSGGRSQLINQQQQKQLEADYDDYISEVHRYVRSNQHSQAIALLLKDYELQSISVNIYENLFYKIKDWGDSKTLLCIGRLVINLLIENKKYARALLFADLCRQVTSEFVLANPDNVLFLARIAHENKQYELAYQLVFNAGERYEKYEYFEQTYLFEIELLWSHLNKPEEAKTRMKQLLTTADGEFKTHLLRLAKSML